MIINMNVQMNIQCSFIWKFLYWYEDMYQIDKYSSELWYKHLQEHLDEDFHDNWYECSYQQTMIIYMKISIFICRYVSIT